VVSAIFHGKRSELYQHYCKGMEDQLGALSLVLNCVLLRNAMYMVAALRRLRALGHQVLDEDVARLSPFVRRHVKRPWQVLVPLARAVRRPERSATLEPRGRPGRGSSPTRRWLPCRCRPGSGLASPADCR
jgi:hypothetical protein